MATINGMDTKSALMKNLLLFFPFKAIVPALAFHSCFFFSFFLGLNSNSTPRLSS